MTIANVDPRPMTVSSTTSPPWATAIARTIEKSETRAVGTLSRRASPREPVEDPGAVLVADTGPGIGDPEPQPTPGLARPDRDPTVGIGVATGVIGQRDQPLGDALRIEHRLHAGHALAHEIPVGQQRHLLEGVLGQSGDVYGGQPQEGWLF